MQRSICVIGLGLIGGSVLRAARQAGYDVFGFNREGTSAEAARADGFDVLTDLTDTLRLAHQRSSLIVVAVPMPTIAEVFAAIAVHAPTCGVTDVVSVKAAVLAAADQAGIRDRFVGGHPMAGTSASGWSAGRSDLFREAAWVVAVDDGVDPTIWREVADLALACGAVVVPVESVEHDSAVARISHLPHILAETLAVTGAEGEELALGLAAGSFRDGTRVAGSSPNLVRAMCEANSTALVAALDAAIATLNTVRASLATQGSAEHLITAGHAARKQYETHQRWDIEGVTIGSGDWVDQLREAGRRGGVIRGLPDAAHS